MGLQGKVKVNDLRYEQATEEIVRERLYLVEVASFPEDEAASLEGMLERAAVTGPLFIVAYDASGKWESDNNKPLGFVNCTFTNATELSHHAMDEALVEGTTVVIQSVTVAEQYRRQGLAGAMLRHWLEEARGALVGPDKTTRVTLALLICKEHLISFYASCGFTYKRVSPIVHGKDTWHEMSYDWSECA